MKSFITVAVVAGVLASLVMAGGCVSNDEYQKALLMNRKMAEEVERLNGLINQQNAKFAAMQKTIDDQNMTISRLTAENKLLADARDALQKALDEASKRGTVAVIKPPPGLPLPNELNRALMILADKYREFLDFDKEHGMVKFKADTTFDPGSDKVKEGAREAVSKLAEILNDPIAQPFNAYVSGHTDDMPILKDETKKRHPNNWYLSVHRAVAIEEILQTDKVAPERLGAMGFGEFHPVAPNAAGHKGNVLNRRVEVWIVPPDRFMTVTGGRTEPAPAPSTEVEK